MNSEVGMRPPARKGIGAYPPACKPPVYKPTGWKRPRREVGIEEHGQSAESME
jgi:hypothetical protein